MPRDGKTIGLTPEDCRRLLDAPDPTTPAGIRDRAILAALAYSACRVGDYREAGGHKVLELFGKGGKERRVPLHPEAFERLDMWLELAGIRENADGPLFRATPPPAARDATASCRRLCRSGRSRHGVKQYAAKLGLDPAVTVHSRHVTSRRSPPRERGSDIIDLQDFAGHSDPRTTLTYIRNRDRLSRSPAYMLRC